MGLKLPKFSGEGDLDVFLHQFDVCAKQFQWNRSDRLCHLRMALSDKAAQLLLQYEHATETEIRHVLKNISV